MSKRYVNYDFYENGIEESVNGEKVNQIIEEIIEIMTKKQNNSRYCTNYFRRYDFLNNKRHSYHIERSNISRKVWTSLSVSGSVCELFRVTGICM